MPPASGTAYRDSMNAIALLRPAVLNWMSFISMSNKSPKNLDMTIAVKWDVKHQQHAHDLNNVNPDVTKSKQKSYCDIYDCEDENL